MRAPVRAVALDSDCKKIFTPREVDTPQGTHQDHAAAATRVTRPEVCGPGAPLEANPAAGAQSGAAPLARTVVGAQSKVAPLTKNRSCGAPSPPRPVKMTGSPQKEVPHRLRRKSTEDQDHTSFPTRSTFYDERCQWVV